MSNEGFGFGSPAQREKQYQRYKAVRAADNVYNHRVGKLADRYENRLVEQDRKVTKKHLTKNAVERLVEDLIVESMAKGEFDNLPGAGKPLPQRASAAPTAAPISTPSKLLFGLVFFSVSKNLLLF